VAVDFSNLFNLSSSDDLISSKKPLKGKNSRLQLPSAFRINYLSGCHNIANFDMIIFVIHFSQNLM
jgi:hypothetical protein